MKKTILTLAIVIASFATTFAQNLPIPSPRATITQEVALSKVTVDYASPAARGRKVWGEVVPLGKVWRTGANNPTTIEVSSDFEVFASESEPKRKLKAGKYAIFSTPNSDNWVIHFNTNDGDWSSSTYKANLDVATFTVKTIDAKDFAERLQFHVIPHNTKQGDAEVMIHWGDKMVRFHVRVEYMEQAKRNILTAVNDANDAWYTLAQSAKYYIENGQSSELALEWANKSIAMEANHFYNRWIRAQILFAMGRKSDAKISLIDAINIGEKNPAQKAFYDRVKPEMEKAKQNW